MTKPSAITTTDLPTVTNAVPFVGNPRCGTSHDPSDESGKEVPIGTYLCAERNYLHKLALDNVAISDPELVIRAGYDHVCAIIGPSDLDTPNLGAREEAANKELLASGVVTSSTDAQAVEAMPSSNSAREARFDAPNCFALKQVAHFHPGVKGSEPWAGSERADSPLSQTPGRVHTVALRRSLSILDACQLTFAGESDGSCGGNGSGISRSSGRALLGRVRGW